MLATIHSRPLSSTRSGTLRRLALFAVGCLMALALLTTDALAGQLPVGLGAADSFAALAGTTVTNTGFSTLNGDLGVSPGSALTGFPPGKVNGTVHATDPVANQAQSDLTAAYNDAAGRTPPIALPADVGGRTLAPGVYKAGAGLAVTGTVTLDAQGDPNAVFIFQVGSTLTTAVASRVNLIGGAQPCNVSWQIGSSATLGTSSVFAGNILALKSISMNDGVTLNGRALARNGAVTLINDTITAAHCAPGTIGGPPTPGGTTSGPPTPGGTTSGPTPPGGTTSGPTPPGGTTSGPTPPGGMTGGPTPPGGMTGGDTRAPAPPILISPRAHATVRAGNVSFRWRAAARAERYTLMVDHHRMNTGPRTTARMRVRPGSHTFRVIAQNRYGARSSRQRAFRARVAGPTTTQLVFVHDGTRLPQSRAAATSLTTATYTHRNSRYTKTDFYGTLDNRARFAPVGLSWSYRLSAAMRSMADGEVTEKASVYTLPKGRKINYSDFHVEAADYIFHSTVTKIGSNQTYRLAINLEFPGVKNGEHGTYFVYVRHQFRIKP